MDKNEIIETLVKLKQEAKERKFNQSVDLIVNLKDINLKRPEEQVEFFTAIPNAGNKKSKVCAIVAHDLEEEAKKTCDTVILQEDLKKYKADKKTAKKIAADHDFFIAQANIMGPIAGAFGRVLGPRGKMPNPKAGCVVPPKGQLGPLYERLQKTVKVSAKKLPVVQIKVGTVDMAEDQIAENVLFFIDQLIHHLPKERHNVKGALLKLSMSKPVKIM